LKCSHPTRNSVTLLRFSFPFENRIQIAINFVSLSLSFFLCVCFLWTLIRSRGSQYFFVDLSIVHYTRRCLAKAHRTMACSKQYRQYHSSMSSLLYWGDIKREEKTKQIFYYIYHIQVVLHLFDIVMFYSLAIDSSARFGFLKVLDWLCGRLVERCNVHSRQTRNKARTIHYNNKNKNQRSLEWRKLNVLI
jgi:hypothetical protein